MASDIWLRTILIVRKETRCRYYYRLTARVLLYAPSPRQDSAYHGLCYISCGAMVGMRSDDLLHHDNTAFITPVVEHWVERNYCTEAVTDDPHPDGVGDVVLGPGLHATDVRPLVGHLHVLDLQAPRRGRRLLQAVLVGVLAAHVRADGHQVLGPTRVRHLCKPFHL